MKGMHWREKDILKLLKKSGKLKTIDIINNSNMCKVTTLKYLKRLRRRGVIDFKKIGPTKIWCVKDESENQNLTPEEGQKKVFELLRDFEEITGVKAKVIITSKGVAFTLDDPEFSAVYGG